MSIWFYISIILSIIIIFLISKIVLIKNSLKDVIKQLEEKLKSDTNTIITVKINDKNIKEIANALNPELKELRTQKLQYENGNQELKKSITNISHDLRTPLTAINGYTDLLQEENLTQEQIGYVKIINKKTGELIKLTEQLFDFSKSLDLENKLNKELCCINDILEEISASFYKLFKEKNIVPNIKICKKKINKCLDKSMFIRICENLISNIIKYSDNDCNIELQENGKIIFSNKTNKLNVTTVQKIFNRYYTVENASKNTGVGLSITKQLVELNKGSITSKYENGSLIIEIEF